MCLRRRGGNQDGFCKCAQQWPSYEAEIRRKQIAPCSVPAPWGPVCLTMAGWLLISQRGVVHPSPRLKQVPADNPERALYPQEVDTSMPISLPSPPVWLQMAIVVMSWKCHPWSKRQSAAFSFFHFIPSAAPNSITPHKNAHPPTPPPPNPPPSLSFSPLTFLFFSSNIPLSASLPVVTQPVSTLSPSPFPPFVLLFLFLFSYCSVAEVGIIALYGFLFSAHKRQDYRSSPSSRFLHMQASGSVSLWSVALSVISPGLQLISAMYLTYALWKCGAGQACLMACI